MQTFEMVQAQEDISLHSTVGLSCYFTGRPTPVMKRMSKLIQDGSYKTIRSMLWSNDTGETYLAVVTCEVLNEKAMLRLTIDEQQRIAKLYVSDELWISVCSGCIVTEDVVIRKLLSKQNSYGSSVRRWINKKVRNTGQTINLKPNQK
ncbi:MAG: hypothetical protein NXH90_05270 [Flavobacteriaceae bacterium]|nr:hypothetical protein [Flavobacteriaceae bacterium]